MYIHTVQEDRASCSELLTRVYDNYLSSDVVGLTMMIFFCSSPLNEWLLLNKYWYFMTVLYGSCTAATPLLYDGTYGSIIRTVPYCTIRKVDLST